MILSSLVSTLAVVLLRFIRVILSPLVHTLAAGLLRFIRVILSPLSSALATTLPHFIRVILSVLASLRFQPLLVPLVVVAIVLPLLLLLDSFPKLFLPVSIVVTVKNAFPYQPPIDEPISRMLSIIRLTIGCVA